MNGIASGNDLFLNGIIGNSIDRNEAKIITFYKTHSGLGLLISSAYNGSHVVVINDDSTLENRKWGFWHKLPLFDHFCGAPMH